MEIKMYSILSGNLNKVGWYLKKDKSQSIGVLRVEFRNGAQYDYYPVSKEKFEEIFIQESKGSWFDREIKKNEKIKYSKVEDIS